MMSSPARVRRFSRWQTTKRKFNLGGSALSSTATSEAPSNTDKPSKKNEEREAKLTRSDHPDEGSLVTSENAVLDVLQNASNHQLLNHSQPICVKKTSNSENNVQSVSRSNLKVRTFESIAIAAIEENEVEVNGNNDPDIQDRVPGKENDESLLLKEDPPSVSKCGVSDIVSVSLQSKEDENNSNLDEQRPEGSASLDDSNVNDINTKDDECQRSRVSKQGQTLTSGNANIQEENLQDGTDDGNTSEEFHDNGNMSSAVGLAIREYLTVNPSRIDSEDIDIPASDFNDGTKIARKAVEKAFSRQSSVQSSVSHIEGSEEKGVKGSHDSETSVNGDLTSELVNQNKQSFNLSVDKQRGLSKSRNLRDRNSIRQTPTPQDPFEFVSNSQKKSLPKSKKRLFKTSTMSKGVDESRLKLSKKPTVDSPRDIVVSTESDTEVSKQLQRSEEEKERGESRTGQPSTDKFTDSQTKMSGASQQESGVSITSISRQSTNVMSHPSNNSLNPEIGKLLPNSDIEASHSQTKGKKLRSKRKSQSHVSSSENDIIPVNEAVANVDVINRSLRNKKSIKQPPSSSYPSQFLSSSQKKSSSLKELKSKSSKELNAKDPSQFTRLSGSQSCLPSKQSKAFKDENDNKKHVQAKNVESTDASESETENDSITHSPIEIANPSLKGLEGTKEVGNSSEQLKKKTVVPRKGKDINNDNNYTSTRDRSSIDTAYVEQEVENPSTHKGEPNGVRSLRRRDSIRKPPSSLYPERFMLSSKKKSLSPSKTRNTLFNSSVPAITPCDISQSSSKKTKKRLSTENSHSVVKRTKADKAHVCLDKSGIKDVEDEKQPESQRLLVSDKDKSVGCGESKVSKKLQKASDVSLHFGPAIELDDPMTTAKATHLNSIVQRKTKDSEVDERMQVKSLGSKPTTNGRNSDGGKQKKTPQVNSRKSVKRNERGAISSPEQEKNSIDAEPNQEKSLTSYGNSSVDNETSSEGRSLRNRSSIRKPPSTSYPVEYLSSNQVKALSLLLSKKKSSQKDSKLQETRKADKKRKYQLPKKRPAPKVSKSILMPAVPDRVADSTLHNSPSLIVVDTSVLGKRSTRLQLNSKEVERDDDYHVTPASSTEMGNDTQVCSSQISGSQPLEDTFHGIHKVRRKRNLFSDSDPPSQSAEIKVRKKGQSNKSGELQQDPRHASDNALPMERNNSKLSTKGVSRKSGKSRLKQNPNTTGVIGDPPRRKYDPREDRASKPKHEGSVTKEKDAVSEWMASYQLFIRQLALT